MTAPNTIAAHCRWLRAEADALDRLIRQMHEESILLGIADHSGGHIKRAAKLRAIAEVLEGGGARPFVCPRCGGAREINMGNSPLTAPCDVCRGEGLVWSPSAPAGAPTT